jgi:hypothetical protein
MAWRTWPCALLLIAQSAGLGAGAAGDEGAATHALHSRLTAELLDFHAAPGARDGEARAALLARLWARFAAHHDDVDAADGRARRAFERNAARIVELSTRPAAANASAAAATFGFTRHAALDPREFVRRLARWRPLPAEAAVEAPAARAPLARLGSSLSASALPASFDWSVRNVLTPVKDQRDCGACWSFTAVATIESAVAVLGGPLLALSAQQLLDCDQAWNQGCVGGNVAASIAYLRSHGAMRAEDYPYRNAAGTEACEYRAEAVAVRVGELLRIPPSTEPQLQRALLQWGPLAVSVDASEWQHYAGGVLARCADGGVNHAVQLVGWGTTANGVDYWSIRNSWSSGWGELGYARLLRGANCDGLIDEPAYTFTVAGHECLANDCHACAAEAARCGWCAGAGRCLDLEATDDAGCAPPVGGWRNASCPPAAAPPPARAYGRRYTCGAAAMAATGRRAPYVAVRFDRDHWRQGSACVLGYELSATQAIGLALLVVTVGCWLLQALAACCGCCDDALAWCCCEDAAPPPRRAPRGGAAAAAEPLLRNDTLGHRGKQLISPPAPAVIVRS